MSLSSSQAVAKRKKLLAGLGALVVCLLIGLGVFAKNGWLPYTDPYSGKRTGWFGSKSSPPYEGGVAEGRGGSLDPNAPLPSSTPQLSKEYIYAGSRLLAVEDAGANAAPPADLAVWRPTSGVWWVMGGQGSQQVTQQWGTNGDDPVEGDYDGDGKSDFSVFRPGSGTWYIVNSSTGGTGQFPLGQSGDIPAQADYDGDGKTDAAVFRSGTWYIFQSSNLQTVQAQFGVAGDTPAPADYDGDGRADLCVWRNSNQGFYSFNSSNGAPQSLTLGSSGGQVVSADYDGDGKADYAIRNGATWNIRKSSTGTTDSITPNGDLASDLPVQNDYDGDGKCDIAVWRPTDNPAGTVGHWYIRQSASSGSLRDVQWGAAGDIPVPAFYRR